MSKACIYFGTGRVLMLAPHLENRSHRLAVIKIVLSLNHPFSVKIENADWQETRAILLDANVSHQLQNSEGYQASITLVPERRRGVQLQTTLLREKKACPLDNLELESYRKQFLTCLEKKHDCRHAFQITVDFIDHLVGTTNNGRKVDARILQIMDTIQASLAESISASVLAKKAFLSEDRFLHLFKEQLGMPLRSYIIYQRVLLATNEFLSGKSLTEAAYLAGFSDSAHFSRTFVQMNGLLPSHFAKLGKTFDVFFCPKLSWL